VSDNNIQYYILNGLLSIEDYASKYIDKIDASHFAIEMRPIIKGIQKFHLKNLKIPSIGILIDRVIPVITKNDPEQQQKCEDIIQSAMAIEFKKNDFYDWLKTETNEFIKKQRVIDALMKAVDIVNNGDVDEAKKLMDEAYQITFDDNLGLDYFGNLEDRMKRLKTGANIINTGLEILNNMIGGGWRNKSLIVFGAGTNVGKTLILSDISFKLIKQGLNGLYVTLEIYEDSLANRIDANLSNIELSELPSNVDYLMQKILEEKKNAEASGNPFGRFIIKEFPPGINCNTILSTIRELNLKQGFKPDFLVIDYIGLLAPNGKTADNSFTDLKKVSEQVRTLSSMLNIPVFTAQQTNRDSYGLSEIGLESTSESMGIPFTADIMIMCSRTKDMEEENQMYWYIAKSRFSKNNVGFFVNVEYPYMRISETNVSIQNISQNVSTKPKAEKRKVEVNFSSHSPNISGGIDETEEWTKTINL
jgi:KaiC/GvpD/RAD55 family RecA-like ATPase